MRNRAVEIARIRKSGRAEQSAVIGREESRGKLSYRLKSGGGRDRRKHASGMQNPNDPFRGRDQIQNSEKSEHDRTGSIDHPELPAVNGNDTPRNQTGTDQCQDERRRTRLNGLEPVAPDEVGKTGGHAAGRAWQPGEVFEGTRCQPELQVSPEALRAGGHGNRQAKSTDEKQATEREQQPTSQTNRVTRCQRCRISRERRIVHSELRIESAE